MRVGIYARVSTKDQNCELQLSDLRIFCDTRKFTVVREYVDVGESGAKDSRPQLNELMADARKRKLDAVIVWRFDRFARSTKHLLLALEEFRSLGIQFISYHENIDTSSPLGQALFTIVSAVAQLERDLIPLRESVPCVGSFRARLLPQVRWSSPDFRPCGGISMRGITFWSFDESRIFPHSAARVAPDALRRSTAGSCSSLLPRMSKQMTGQRNHQRRGSTFSRGDFLCRFAPEIS